MLQRDRWRESVVAVVVAAVISGLLLMSGPRGRISGISTDTQFWLRDKSFGTRRPSGASEVSLILIDEATYAQYKDMAKDFWSPYYATVIDALLKAPARIIGFDIVLPTSISAMIPGYDLAFWKALRSAGAAGKLVMATAQSGHDIVEPAREQIIMVGKANLSPANLESDADGVVRRQRLMLRAAGTTKGEIPSFAAEIARRAGWSQYGGDLLINFDGGQPFSTYSLADIVACAKAGNLDYFATHFRDRVVLIGTGLQFEDRRLTSRRFINPPERITGQSCNTGVQHAANPFSLNDLPGIFIHAAVIDNLLRNEGLRTPGLAVQWLAVLAAALVGGLLGLRAGFIRGGMALLGLLATVTIGSTELFEQNIDGPFLEMLLAATLTYFPMLGFRLVIAEQHRQRIRQMFGFYLSPDVVAQLEALGGLPERGGERREMTFFFSDIAGFTTVTEAADPGQLAETLNAYFDGVCNAVEGEGGIVIEFLGDGVQAMFGAPLEQLDHAARAVAAARKVDRFSESFRGSGTARDIGFGHTRLGIHTGEALVGNIGASRRLKYAALGDCVNATSRLEGLNKYFGTRICVSAETVRASGDSDVRPIGDFLLKGKTQSVRVFEVLMPGEGNAESVRQYRTAFALLSEGDPGAVALLEQLFRYRPQDEVVAFFLGRAREGELSTVIRMSDK